MVHFLLIRKFKRYDERVPKTALAQDQLQSSLYNDHCPILVFLRKQVAKDEMEMLRRKTEERKERKLQECEEIMRKREEEKLRREEEKLKKQQQEAVRATFKRCITIQKSNMITKN